MSAASVYDPGAIDAANRARRATRFEALEAARAARQGVTPAPRPREVLPRQRACTVCGETGHRADNPRHRTTAGVPEEAPSAARAPAPLAPVHRAPANDSAADEPAVAVPVKVRQMSEDRTTTRQRAATVPATGTLKERRALALTVVDEDELAAARPRRREDCKGGARPCPFVSCAHHLFLDVNPESGSIKFNHPHLEVWEMAETCSLDVADRGGITLEEVGAILNLTRERIRQVEVKGIDRLRAGMPAATEPDVVGPQTFNRFQTEAP